MSEYWISVPRKFCDFCKCWITDNKPSVEFHERGKRHQENVELRLREVRKKSSEKFREDSELEKQMEQVEKAALEAFKKDLKDNPALAAQYGVSLEPKPKPKPKDADTDKTGSSSDPTEDTNKTEKEWYEAKSDEGYSYYWSTVTGESKWEAPDEYESLAEQKEAEEKAKEKAKAKKEEKEKEKECSPTEKSEDSEASTAKRVDPSFSRSAFGAWDVVTEKSQAVLYDDKSEAPALDDIPLPVASNEPSQPKVQKQKFKEKTVTSLGPSTGGVTFKKRKIVSGARNVRQRDDAS